ncbi:DUF2865 domain-containing protein [Devosia albogilva]|uniref:DUF2865 domain-containing protein n=1 Tax=Devosia albogilva TaxID=429726 RepID=A0ABW5QN14_9HYPH
MTDCKRGVRALLLIVVAAVCLVMDVDMAHAQAAQCANLSAMLQQFDRNSEFQQFGGGSQAARQLQQAVQAAESRYIRDGCNDDARAGRVLTPHCQQVAQEVLRLRDDYSQVAEQVETANAVAGQREAILQEMARFGCGAGGSSATFTTERQGVFDRIFGTTSETDFSGGQMIDGSGYWGAQGFNTVRTVCVRLSDGYFWPISYATLPDYVQNDAMTCQQMCPNTQVELYFYDNPGQEPEQMRNIYGQPYTSLPNAFRYREEVDMSSTCDAAPQVQGKIAMAEDGSRAVVEVGEARFPLPMRDPRGQQPVQAPIQAPLETVASVDVPLPRPRPAGPGETPVTRAIPRVRTDNELRLVQFGNKVVRVVGPDTPYAQPVEAGT